MLAAALAACHPALLSILYYQQCGQVLTERNTFRMNMSYCTGETGSGVQD